MDIGSDEDGIKLKIELKSGSIGLSDSNYCIVSASFYGNNLL